MEFRINIKMENPGITIEDVRGAFFESFVGYAALNHFQDASQWDERLKESPDDLSAKMIRDHHKTWADIWEKAEWSVEAAGGMMVLDILLDVPHEGFEGKMNALKEEVSDQKQYIVIKHREACMEILVSENSSSQRKMKSYQIHDMWADKISSGEIHFIDQSRPKIK